MKSGIGEKLADAQHAEKIGQARRDKAQKYELAICSFIQKLSPIVVLSVFGYYPNTIYLRPMEKCESG